MKRNEIQFKNSLCIWTVKTIDCFVKQKYTHDFLSTMNKIPLFTHVYVNMFVNVVCNYKKKKEL